jgi:hypothetical protein
MLIRTGWRALFALVLLTPGLSMAQEGTKPLPKAEPPTGALKGLTVYPPQVTLDGPRDEQRLGVLGEYGDGLQWDFSRNAMFSSSTPNVAIVDQSGVLRPVGDGQATITVQAGGQSATIPV